jgi:hypothetical protein
MLKMTLPIVDIKVDFGQKWPTTPAQYNRRPPVPDAPSGWTVVPIDCNAFPGQGNSSTIWVRFKRGLGTPVTSTHVINGSTSSISAPSGYTKIAKDLNADVEGDYIYLCFKRQEGVTKPVTDLFIHSKRSGGAPDLPGYSTDGLDLNAGAGGGWVYLYERRSRARTSPFLNGITPAALNDDPEREIELSRCQVSNDRILIRLHKLQRILVRTLAPGQAFVRTQKWTKGASLQDLKRVTSDSSIEVGAEYSAISAKVNQKMGYVHETTYRTYKDETVEEPINIPAADRVRYVAMYCVADVLRVINAFTEGVISEAITATDISGVFVTKANGNWAEA